MEGRIKTSHLPACMALCKALLPATWCKLGWRINGQFVEYCFCSKSSTKALVDNCLLTETAYQILYSSAKFSLRVPGLHVIQDPRHSRTAGWLRSYQNVTVLVVVVQGVSPGVVCYKAHEGHAGLNRLDTSDATARLRFGQACQQHWPLKEQVACQKRSFKPHATCLVLVAFHR